MAGFPLQSIVQAITVSQSFGAFDCSQFKNVRVTGTTSVANAINARIESQQEDGTWVALFGNFLSTSAPAVFTFDVTVAVPRSGRITVDFGAATNLNLSVWGLA
jgi:hypothetical protein